MGPVGIRREEGNNPQLALHFRQCDGAGYVCIKETDPGLQEILVCTVVGPHVAMMYTRRRIRLSMDPQALPWDHLGSLAIG